MENSGPIELTLAVVISKALLQYLEDKALQEALTANLASLKNKKYVDDSQARFKTLHQCHSFLNMLNRKNKAMQCTMAKEGWSQKLNFLDVIIINNGAEKYGFKIHRKNAITNVQIKPNLFVNSSLIKDILKGFLSRAKKLCSEKYIEENLNFLMDIFVEDGYDRNYLNSIVKEDKYQAPKTENTDNNIIKLLLIAIIGPKIRKELRKTGF